MSCKKHDTDTVMSCVHLAGLRSTSLQYLGVEIMPVRLVTAMECQRHRGNLSCQLGATLGCTHETSKSDLLQAAGDVVRLHTPELRNAELDFRTDERITVTVDEHSFVDADRLERLVLQHWHKASALTVVLAPQSLAPLTALKELCLSHCGLTGVPCAVVALSDSLTSLILLENFGLRLRRADTDRLLKLRRLRKLDVSKHNCLPAGAANSLQTWDEISIQLLINLPSAFLTQHGFVPKIEFASYLF